MKQLIDSCGWCRLTVAMMLFVSATSHHAVHGIDDCQAWSAYTPLTSYESPGFIWALVEYKGDLIAGGNNFRWFDDKGNLLYSTALARWDGSEWHPIDGLSHAQAFTLPQVRAMIEYNGDLIVGGWFHTAGGQTANNIARWDGTDWHPLGNGIGLRPDGVVEPGSRVYALGFYNNNLVVGGNFNFVNGKLQSYGIVAWSGSDWLSINNGTPFTSSSGRINAVIGYGGKLIAGGAFIVTPPGESEPVMRHIAQWNGSSWQPLGEGLPNTSGAEVRTIQVYKGELIVGGSFASVGGVPASYIARWNGWLWQPLGAGLTGPSQSLLVHGGDLIVSGPFAEAGGQTVNSIAQWDGDEWHAIGNGLPPTNLGFPQVVSSILFYEGKLYEGKLTVVGSVEWPWWYPRLAQWGCKDSDGDGIPDDWEINGIPYLDSAGIEQRYHLPGADPMRKDLFVEVDVMRKGDGNVPFSLNALDEVKQAFADAPVQNPDGSTGITLHIVVDELVIPHKEIVPVAEVFSQIRPQWFGTEAERNDPNSEAILAAKAKAFRYCAFLDRSTDGNVHLLGYAQDIHAATFMVSLGGENMIPADLERYLGSIFMHELGHALGLRHGGGDDINYKPNYISALNYNFNEIRLANGDRVPLDFSREEVLSLNEAELDENAGLPTEQEHFANATVPHAYFDEAVMARRVKRAVMGGGAVDWNGDGEFKSDAVEDLNWFPFGHPFASFDSAGEILVGINDWLHLKYAVPPVPLTDGGGGAGSGCPSGSCVCLLSEELLAWHAEHIPPHTTPCPADLTGNGSVGVPDLLALLACWGPTYPGCEVADLTANGSVGVPDLLALLANWGPCP